MNRLYSFLRTWTLRLFRLIFRWQVVGQENIPSSGGLLICANHRSWWDPVYITMAITRQIHFMAKEELFRVPIFGTLIRALGAFPIKRGQGDLASIRLAMQLLKEGKAILIFPEGTRNKTDQPVLPGQPGAAYLAIRSQATVLPLAICRYPKGLFSPIMIKIGEGIEFKDYSSQKFSTAELEKISNNTIMKGIERLIREAESDASFEQRAD